MPNKIQHWVRYGIAGDQKYLLDEFADTYDQLVVNGNMIAHMPSAMSLFLSQKAQKPFVIDPQTHAFQHQVEYLLSTSKKSAGELKRSWRGLVDSYGKPLTTIFGGKNPRPLIASDLDDEGTLRGFCGRVLDFQRSSVNRVIEQGADSKYLKFLAKKRGVSSAKCLPAMIVAPYFFVGGPDAEYWLKLNTRCLRLAKSIKTDNAIDIPLAAQVVVSKDVLTDEALVTRLVASYRKHLPDFFLIWIDDFVEQAATQRQLEGFVTFVEALSGLGAKVINLYGGFFSVAQARFGSRLSDRLIGVCHGLEYGESKPVVPMSGGIPVAKFYSNSLHSRLPPRVAYLELVARQALETAPRFHQQICDCDECRRHIRNKPRNEFVEAYGEISSKSVWRAGQWIPMQFPTADASDHCTRHYMWCKREEFAGNASADSTRNGLREAYRVLKPSLGSDYVSHARLWAEIL